MHFWIAARTSPTPIEVRATPPYLLAVSGSRAPSIRNEKGPRTFLLIRDTQSS
jgi:hypothetical protein